MRLPCLVTLLAAGFVIAGSPAGAGECALGPSVGALGQGAQGTVKGGAAGGVSLELRTSERYEFGIGYSYGEDSGGGSNYDPRVTVQVVDFQARRYFGSARVKPYFDVGLGWYHLRHESTFFISPGESTTSGLGGPLGAGAAYSFSDRVNLRVGAEYHMIAAEPTLGTGNMEDYFWVGAALMFRISGGS